MHAGIILLKWCLGLAIVLLITIIALLRRTAHELGGWNMLTKQKKVNIFFSAVCFISSFVTILIMVSFLLLFLWLSAAAEWSLSQTIYFISALLISFFFVRTGVRGGIYLLKNPIDKYAKRLIGISLVPIVFVIISSLPRLLGFKSPEEIEEADYYKSSTYFNEGKYELAIEGFNRIGSTQYYKLTASYIKLGNFDSALEICNKYIEKKKSYDESPAGGHALRGAVYYWRGDYDLAIREYQTVIELCAEEVGRARYESLISIANCQAKLGNYDHALEMLNSAIKFAEETDVHKDYHAYKPNVIAILNRGNFYLWRGQFDRAMDDYNKAIEINDTYEPAFELRANLFTIMKDYKNAIADLNRIIPSASSTYIYRLHRERAYLYNKMGMHKKAGSDTRICNEYLRKRPDDVMMRETNRITGIPALIEPFDCIKEEE